MEGFTFIGKPFSEIRPFLESRDPDFDEDDDGITSYKLGIALYIPALRHGDWATVEGIMVFRKGYYELGRELLQKEEEEALNSANSSKENTFFNRVKACIKRLLKLES
ncbi:MAG: hypothetical protein D6732_09985 [Methanobacteriota archaeon]|nr:MAG: hypothetical protein D6732_09985 [Euryarchaeota archaeon]